MLLHESRVLAACRLVVALLWAASLDIAAASRVRAGNVSHGFEVQGVMDDVFALVRPLGDRSPETLGNTTTYGIAVTSKGVVLIDSGGHLQERAAHS